MAGRVECKDYGEGIICEHGREKRTTARGVEEQFVKAWKVKRTLWECGEEQSM
jgi:hypothetical protein